MLMHHQQLQFGSLQERVLPHYFCMYKPIQQETLN